jgi:hypothetical protein
MSLLDFLRARLEFVGLSTKAGVDPAPLQQDVLKSLESRLGMVRGVGVQESAAILAELNNSVLPMEVLRKAADLVVAKTSVAADTTTQMVKVQTHDYFESYLSHEEWGLLENPQSEEEVVQQVLASKAVAIGLLNPSEQTVKAITALYTLHKPQGDARMTLFVSRQLKKLIHTMAAGASKGPVSFPQSIEQFSSENRELYAQAFPEGKAGPAPSRVTRAQLLRERCLTPCRSTKAACAGMQGAKSAGPQCVQQPCWPVQQPMPMLTWQAPPNHWQKRAPLALMDLGHRSPPPTTSDLARRAASSWGVPLPPHVKPEVQVGSASLPAATDAPVEPSAGLREAGPPNTAEVATKTGQLSTMLASMQELAVKSKGLKQEEEGKEVTPPRRPKPEQQRSQLKRPAAAEPATFGWLPKRFQVIKKVRLSGTYAGEPYYTFVSPCGKQLRSRREVEEFVC